MSASSQPLRRSGYGFGFISGLATGVVFSCAIFAAVVVLLFAFNGTPVDAAEPIRLTSTDDTSAQRPIGEIRRDLKAFVKNSKQDDDWSLQVGAVVDLCYLHREIVSDQRFATNTQLQGFRAQIASRLKKYQREVKVLIARRNRKLESAKKQLEKQLRDGHVVEGDSVADLGDLTDGDSSEEDSRYWDEILNRSMMDMGGIVGGPSQLFGYLGGNFAPPWDHGEELVDLIESTIHSDSWQRNGGEGRIQYYRPSRIIVVSATSRVHDDITDALRKLRFLSR